MTNPNKIFTFGALALALGVATLPASAGTAAGTPAKSVCTVRNADATLRTMTPVDLPQLAAQERISGTAIVKIDLDEQGVASNAVIVQSAGSKLLDNAALKAALAQGYAPQIRDCESVGGSYRVVVDFSTESSN